MSFFSRDFPGKNRQKLSTFFAKNIGIFWGFPQKHVIPERARPKPPFSSSFYSKKVAIFGFWPLFWPLFRAQNGRKSSIFSQIPGWERAQTRVPRLFMLVPKPLFSKSEGGGVPLQTGGLGGQGGSDPHTPGVWGVPLGDPSGLGVRNPPKGGPDRPNRVPKRPKTGRFGCGSRRCLSFGRGRNGNRARTARKDRQ